MEILPIIKSDPYLEPYAAAIYGRYEYFRDTERKLLKDNRSLSEFASGYLYFGLHRLTDGWVFREWAPNATAIYMIGDFNNWQKHPDYLLKKLQNGIWEIKLPEYALAHTQLYKLLVEWDGGNGERIPAWTRRVVQDEQTKIFSAQVWHPIRPYSFRHKVFRPSTAPLLIYECHIGMSGSEEKVSSYNEFRTKVLPRIVEA